MSENFDSPSGVRPILLIDDMLSDAKLITRYAQRAKIINPVVHFQSGPEALDYLDTCRPIPALILLDLNMPVMNGHDVLTRIRCHPNAEIARIPIVILTTSNDVREVNAAYSEHANSYVVKPVDLAGFHQVMSGLADYWFEIVQIPTTAT